MSTIDTPLVSVIIITYNSARYVMDTLESVRIQSWENIELIVSDDASTDQTIQICYTWIEKNKERFTLSKVITVPHNTGISSNCNRGLRASNGKWIKMIAGDDILLENAITDNLAYTRQHPEASLIVSDLQEIDENGKLIRDKVINEALVFFVGLPTVKKQIKNYCRWPAFLNTPSFFCKREMLEEIKQCNDEFRIYEDMVVVFRILENGFKLHYMKKPTVAYRVHVNAISRNPTKNVERKKETLKFFREFRMRHLKIFNLLDLSVIYESWLNFKYSGFNGRRGGAALRKLSLFYWYMKFKGVKSY